VTLTTLGIAWAAVAALFLVWARLARGRLNRAAVLVTLAESFTLTLLAGLWFGSLGHGGWLLVFLLLGALVGGAERGLRFAFLRSAGWAEVRGFVLDLARYAAAGALLAWRLG